MGVGGIPPLLFLSVSFSVRKQGVGLANKDEISTHLTFYYNFKTYNLVARILYDMRFFTFWQIIKHQRT